MRTVLLLPLLLAAACSNDAAAPASALAGDTEAPEDSAPPQDTVAASEDTTETEDIQDPGPPFPLQTRDPLTVSPDPLAQAAVEGCAVYQAERCNQGTRQVCRTWSTTSQAFGEPDSLLRRVLLYDRWYDLYHQPDGQTVNRRFVGATPAGTPEAEWAAGGHFKAWGGEGDSAIWTGTALNAYLFRYAVFGTAADYARVEQKVRDHLLQFDVTGIPGYLARFHYLEVPDGAPLSPEHILRRESDNEGHKHHTIGPDVEGLPEGYAAIGGTPRWVGNPSIDQYTGPLTALPMAWGLLKDEALKARITTHLTCYLKRLRKLEVINLQDNPDALKALQTLLAGGSLTLEPGDMDFSELTSLVAYYLEQPNSKNVDTFDRTCPEAMNTEPTRVIDAAADTFLLDLLGLATDFQSKDNESATGIDHLYVSVRGGDAVHLIHMAAIAWHLTGEEQYRTFLYDEVLTNLRALDVADTAGAFQLPPWCTSYYGHHITFMPWWSLITLLDEGPLRTRLEQSFHHEQWELTMKPLKNAKFELMYAGALAPDIAVDRGQATADAVAQLEALGGNGGVLDDPRRSYGIDPQTVLDALPEGIAPRCPTEAERAACEDGFNVLGIPFPGEPITRACTGAPNECPLEGEVCAERLAYPGLPSNLRPFEDFLWQRSPFEVGQSGNGGHEQSPGLDLTESYWLARYYGAIDDPAQMVLAWQDAGACQ